MGVNRVRYETPEGEKFLVDMTDATVTPETLADGVTAYDANGDLITGEMKGNNGLALLRSGFCGNTEADEVYYSFYEDGTLIISGTGEIVDNDDNDTWSTYYPWKNYDTPENDFYSDIKKVIIEDGVVNIPTHCFVECTNLESVIMSDSVIHIKEGAFAICSALTDIIISSNVRTIGVDAFCLCPFENIVLPYGLTEIGHDAFALCKNLKSLIIPDSVTTIGSNAFWECESLTKIVLSQNLTKIAGQLFLGCTSLKEIFIPKSVTKIKYEALHPNDTQGYDAVPLEKIYYSGTKAEWEQIEIEEGNEALKSATLYCEYNPNTNIIDGGQCGENVYWKLYDNGTLHIYGEGDMYYYDDEISAPFPTDKMYHLIVEDGVNSIGSWCFQFAENLKTLTIGNTVPSIGDKLFSYCTSLTSASIPDSVESIGWGAFEYCENLTSVTIGSGVKSISHQAFRKCPNLTDVLFKGTKEEWDNIQIDENNEPLLNATLHCEYDPNADTVDGWHFDVRLDGSEPPEGITDTISLIFTVGG